MLELINTTSQTIDSTGIVNLGTTTIKDNGNRVTIKNGTTLIFNTLGKYNIHAIFNLSNSGSTATNITISLYNGTTQYGLPITATVPSIVGSVNGAEEIVIDKTVNVTPDIIGNVAELTFIATTNAVISGCLVDVYKRS